MVTFDPFLFFQLLNCIQCLHIETPTVHATAYHRHQNQISVFEIEAITSSVNSSVRPQNTWNDRMHGFLSLPPIKKLISAPHGFFTNYDSFVN